MPALDPYWSVQLLGGLVARHASAQLSRFRTQKTASLLAYLAFYRFRSHPRDLLIDLLWPEASPDAGRLSLSKALSSLRHQLEPPDLPAGTVFRVDRLSLALNPEALTTDVAHFETSLVAAARATRPGERAKHLEEAARLYRGELLPGFYEEWVVRERERLQEQFVQALRGLIAHCRQVGDVEGAVGYARRAIEADPLREEGYQELIGIYVAQGEGAKAVREYRELERRLEAELGLAPSEEIRALLAALAPTTDHQSPTEGVRPAAGPSASPRRQTASGVTEPASDDAGTAVGGRWSAPGSEATMPWGIVTLLLADAEGTDEPADRGRDDAATASLRREARRYGGHELPATGPEVAIAFARASDALACALAARRLPPPGGGPPPGGRAGSVRLALHTGELSPQEGLHPGAALERAVRLLRAAHPGQTLCSEETAVLLRRELEPDLRLADLGLYRLAGSPAPERIFQLAERDRGPLEFPPLTAERSHQSNLPLPLTRFFGRESEIARLGALLEGSRLVTLTGPGGSGKTRLALEAARRLGERLEGAVWFLPLADLADPSRIPEAILDALGLQASPETEPLDQVVAFLERQPCLLLLDNYEHLVERGGAVVRRLLERTPALTCLVTSRRRLDLDGEREFPVRPLPVPERLLLPPEDQRQPRPVGRRSPAEEPTALPEWLVQCPSIQLLVDRAQAVAPDFQVTSGTVGAVAELCRRLEGVPLALELAAARVSVMTPAQIVARLDHCLDLLVRQRRDVSPRHRSLRATLDWSYQLLAPELRRFLAQLSVFRGGWSLEAAEAICEEPLALDYLEQLRDCSLIMAELEGGDPALAMPGMRYRMLETLREYGWEQLAASGELAATRTRHRDWYLRLAEQADAAAYQPEVMPKEWLTRLEAELDNLRAALGWCREAGEERIDRDSGQRRGPGPGEANPASPAAEAGLRLATALGWLWTCRGDLTEGLQWLEGLLARGSHLSASLRAPALRRAGHLARDRGDSERWHTLAQAARREYEQVLTLARREGNLSDIAHTLQSLASVAYNDDDLDAAWSYCVEARPLFEELAEPAGIALTLECMAGVYFKRGDLRAARPLLEERLAICRKLGDPGLMVHALGGMGHLEREEGSYARAQALYRESLLLRRELGALFALAQSLEDLAVLAGRQRQTERAIRLLGAAEAFCETLDIRPPVADPAEYERTVTEGRAVLGEAGLPAAWAAGRALSLEEAVAFALEERSTPIGAIGA